MVLIATSGCIADSDSATEPNGSRVIPIANVAAMTQLANGDVVVGNRKTGEIWRMSLVELQPRLVATVAVASDGQRGLLGLASAGSADQEALYISWTNLERDLVVGRLVLDNPVNPSENSSNSVQDEQPTLVWSGFASATGANGGHLDVLPDGRLVLGVGTLLDSKLIDDPETINGKMLALQPDASPAQRPEILSAGWKNPFAFAVTEAGEIWVADNEPEDGSAERIGRGDIAPSPAMTDIEVQLAPGALILVDSERLGLCSYLTGEMLEVTISTKVPTQPGSVITDDCRTGGLLLADGRFLVSDGDVVRLKAVDQ